MHIFRSKVFTAQTGSTTQTVKNQPQGTIALLGLEVSGGADRAYAIFNAGLQTDALVPAISLSFVKGSRTSYGTLPIEQGDTIFVGFNVVDPLAVTPAYTVAALLLVADTAEELKQRPIAVPFKASGAYDSDGLVQFEQISAATTAQTLTLTNAGNVDQLEIVAAWFQTNAPSTATGNFGYWDGAIRTDIDTTVAIAGYVFNIAAKGPRPRITGGFTTISFRFVIGAAAAGTTTLYVIARPIAAR